MIAEAFDREVGLLELTRGLRLEPLRNALEELLQAPVRLVDVDGSLVFGSPTPIPGARRHGLQLELEPIGFLETTAREPALRAAATLLRQVLSGSARYLMASDLHLQSVHTDFEELKERHSALQESEERYRILAAELEARVKAQVGVIEQAQRQLYQAEKMGSVGRLAAGVAHEINNPMGFVRSNLGTADGYVDELHDFATHLDPPGAASWRNAKLDLALDDFRDLLRESIEGVDRVSRIVASLKRFSSVDRQLEETVDLNDTIRAVCEVAEAQTGRALELALELGDVPPLRCRPAELAQALMALVSNAAEAYDASAKAWIGIASESRDGQIVVSIEDRGCGVSGADLTRIFDPFFTTREVGKGMGLGLTVCRDAVRGHGGDLEVSSQTSVGTRVVLRLPVRS